MKFIEQGHVRVGSEVVTDPAFLVTRYAFFFAFAFPWLVVVGEDYVMFIMLLLLSHGTDTC